MDMYQLSKTIAMLGTGHVHPGTTKYYVYTAYEIAHCIVCNMNTDICMEYVYNYI